MYSPLESEYIHRNLRRNKQRHARAQNPVIAYKIPTNHQLFPTLRRTSSDNTIFVLRSDVGRCPTRFLLRLFARCRSLSDAFFLCSTGFSQQIAQVVLFLFLHVFLF
jgi:hypothetical protein